MNSQQLLKEKDNKEFMLFDKTLLKNIKLHFSKSNTKLKKKSKKKIKKVDILSSRKNLSNEIILILNKIGSDNIDNIVIEFLNTIEINSIEDFNNIQIEIYLKLIKDINFIEYYLQFLIYIFKIINFKNNFIPTFFFEIIQEKINIDYVYEDSSMLDKKYEFLNKLNDEIFRNNNLILIYNLNKYNYFNKNNNIFNYMTNILINQNKYLIDIYFWFNITKIDINTYQSKITNKIKHLDKYERNYILLNSLLNNEIKDDNKNYNIYDNSINENKKINESETNRTLVKITNLIEEYIYIQSDIEIIEYIKTDCNNYNKKNSFCLELLKAYFKYDSIEWINLFHILIKNKHLHKSNFSLSFIKYFNNTNINNIKKLKVIKLLNFLKENNITKNIEHLFKKYNIKLTC